MRGFMLVHKRCFLEFDRVVLWVFSIPFCLVTSVSRKWEFVCVCVFFFFFCLGGGWGVRVGGDFTSRGFRV